jgi:hypothetical protein
VIAKMILSGFMGAAICAILGFVMFFLLATMDGTKVDEAFGYSLLVGLGCVFIGGIIGLVIGLANLKAIGGAVIGLLATLCIVALYVLAVGRPGQKSYFLGESRVIWFVLSIPTILTGILTALLKGWLLTSKSQ